MKAALYARCSTNDKKQDVENQFLQLRDYCRKQGYTIAHEYFDYASGGRSDREQFQAMFTAAHQRAFDIVIVWALDRLSREGPVETINYITRLDSYGVGFKSFTEPFFDSVGIFKEALIAILATLAKQERIQKSDRIRAGLERVKRQGRKLGAKKKALDLDMVRALKAQGMSLRAIARETGVSPMTIRRRGGG